MVGLGGEGTLVGDALAVVSIIAYSGLIVISNRNPGISSLPAPVLSVSLTTVVAIPFMTDFSIHHADLPMLATFGVVNSAFATLVFMIVHASARHPDGTQRCAGNAAHAVLGLAGLWHCTRPSNDGRRGHRVVGAVARWIVQGPKPANH